MPFDVTRHGQDGPFRPAFLAGLLFCILVPTLLLPLLSFLDSALGYAIWLSNPWNRFGPGATFSDAPIRELLTRTKPEWAAVLVPVALCAAFWLILNRRRERLVPPWIFIPMALLVPLLIALIAVPIAAYEFDSRARAMLDFAIRFLHQDGALSQRWLGFYHWTTAFLMRSFTWLNQGFSLNAPRPTLLLSAVQTYILLVPATWLFARAVFAYATARRTGTLSAAVRTVAYDGRNWVSGAVRNAVNGLNEKGTRDTGSRVARAVALPWLIPAVCTLAFLVINGVFSPFPLMLVLLVLVAYVVARLTWRFAERLHITSYRIGGAAAGLLCAILATMVCSIASIQSFGFLRPAGDSPSYGLLVSYLPPYIAMFMSLGRGMRAGWRSAAVTPPPSAASQPA